MVIETLDLLVRGATGALLLLLAFLFGRESGAAQTARFGAALSISGIAYLLSSALPPVASWRWWEVPLALVAISGPALSWLFIASWFDDEFRLQPRHIVILGLTMLLNFVGIFCFSTAYGWLAWYVVHGVNIGFVAMGLWAALRGRAADLIEQRRRIRLLLAVDISIVVLIVLATERPSVGPWNPQSLTRLIDASALLLLAVTICGATLGWRDAALLSPPPRPAPPSDSANAPDDGPLLAALEQLMRHDRLYRQEGLTITAVAARLGVPEYRLRRAINQGSGARNFNSFLNAYRLEDVEQALTDPAQREVPILTIALDAGFGSLAPFNRAFKAANGRTPTEYRAQALAIPSTNQI